MASLDPDLRAVIENSASVDREAYMSAVDQQIALTRNNRLFHQTYDLLVTPTLAVAAFEVGRNVEPDYDTANCVRWKTFTDTLTPIGKAARGNRVWTGV